LPRAPPRESIAHVKVWQVLLVLAIVAATAVGAAKGLSALRAARITDNEGHAIGGLRTLATAQGLFREGDKDRNGRLDYASSLEALGKAGLIDGVFAKGDLTHKCGYRFRVLAATDASWSAVAEPSAPGSTGSRFFLVSESGAIRASTTGPASASDPVVTR